MGDFLKTYGIFVGFFLGIISVYIKHFVDKRLVIGKVREKLNKLYLLIEDSPPPEWIKTYTEPELEMIYPALHQNGRNLSQFKSRVQAINACIDEMSSDIYANLEAVDIVKFNEIKFWVESILRQINEDKKKFQKLDFSANDKLRAFGELDTLSEAELEEMKEIMKIADENQSNFNSYIIGTSSSFLMIKFGHQHMVEACHIKSISTLEYDYAYEGDEANL